MDEIRIKELTVFAHHGVFEEEARLGQKFLLSAVLRLDLHPAGQADQLDLTLNYAEVCQFMTDFLQDHRFQLLEACVDQLAQALLDRYPQIQELSLEIHKPWAPVGLPLEDLSVAIERKRHTAFLALGSNLGDRKAYLQEALEGLQAAQGVELKGVSSFIETAPYGVTDQPGFLNGVCQIETTLTAHELLDLCHRLEQAAHRERKVHWGPRTLDLDILFYDQAVIAEQDLNVPHPDLANRDFVLKPMAELAPWWLHPLTGRTMAQMAADWEARQAQAED